jgi:uncharacterized ferritin-like protein (DUF455 family)
MISILAFLIVSLFVRSGLIVRKIADEELAHVAVGVTWFMDVCRRSGVDPGESFQGW